MNYSFDFTDQPTTSWMGSYNQSTFESRLKTCGLCSKSFLPNDQMFILLHCKHVLHEKCFKQCSWDKECPVDGTPIQTFHKVDVLGCVLLSPPATYKFWLWIFNNKEQINPKLKEFINTWVNRFSGLLSESQINELCRLGVKDIIQDVLNVYDGFILSDKKFPKRFQEISQKFTELFANIEEHQMDEIAGEIARAIDMTTNRQIQEVIQKAANPNVLLQLLKSRVMERIDFTTGFTFDKTQSYQVVLYLSRLLVELMKSPFFKSLSDKMDHCFYDYHFDRLMKLRDKEYHIYLSALPQASFDRFDRLLTQSPETEEVSLVRETANRIRLDRKDAKFIKIVNMMTLGLVALFVFSFLTHLLDPVLCD